MSLSTEVCTTQFNCKTASKKPIETVAKKKGVIIVGDVRASFQAKEESEGKKQTQTHIATLKKYRNRRK